MYRSVSKIVLITVQIHCSIDLNKNSISRPSALNFKSFAQSIEYFFLHTVRTILETKYHFWLRTLNGSKVMLLKRFKIHSFFQLNHTAATMVFCYRNCSDLLWEKIVLVIEKNFLKLKAEGREFANILRSLEQFVRTVKGPYKFW